MNQTPQTPTTDSTTETTTKKRILNIGCGLHKIPGAVNVDSQASVNPDCLFDLESCGIMRPIYILAPGDNPLGPAKEVEIGREPYQLPFSDDEFDVVLASHVLEHIKNILPLMQELHRVAKPGARMHIRVPYGSHSIAFEDPTHVRQFFPKSFEYFGQMAYNAADYGYRGDWEIEQINLAVDDQFQGMSADEIAFMIERAFNIVKEMFVTLMAIKPIRKADGVPRTLEIRFEFESSIHKQMMEAANASKH